MNTASNTCLEPQTATRPPMAVFSGNSNIELSSQIASRLELRLGNCELTRFSDGEIRTEFHSHVRGHEVFIVQSTCSPSNDNLMELLIMADALKRSDVEKVTAVIPYYGYSRQDRRPAYTRTPITSRLVAELIQTSGIDRVITVDIHSEQQLGFFNIPVINVSASPMILADIWKEYGHRDPMIVSPDVGGVARARQVAKQVRNADLAIIDKRRPEANISEVMNVIGEVEGKNCIIVDDMIDTAGTLCKAADALKARGAKTVVAYATHPIFSGRAYENIERSGLDEVVVTNTIPIQDISQKIRTLSMGDLLAETIARVHQRTSISALYA